MTGSTDTSGVYANAGGQVTLSGGSVTTSGADSSGVYANAGGRVTLSGGSVATSGSGSLGLYATGAGSQISATNLSITTSGGDLNAIYADAGANITVSGGSASTSGLSSYVIGATGAATVNLSGTTITATGDGSGGLAANGTGSTITATGISITTNGNVDTSTGSHASGIANQTYSTYIGGGIVTLSDSTMLTTGGQANGSYTANGGITTLTNDSIATQGTNSLGVITDVGGTTIISGGSITTAGTQSVALESENGGSTNMTGGSINTTGAASYAINALSGGVVSLSGTTINTTGDGSGGLYAGGGGSITASNVTITTQGAYDPVSGQHSRGVVNGPNASGSITTGGVITLTNSSVTTNGAEIQGVLTSTGGTTTLTGTSVTTNGVSAPAVESSDSGSTILNGVNSIMANGAGSIGLYADSGGAVSVSVGGTTTIAANGVNGIGVEVSGGSSINATGALKIGAGDPTGIGLLLTGANASFTASGGGSITSAGTAVALENGTNLTTSFTGFTISEAPGVQTGNLFYADPASATINLTNTTANAGAGNLLDATDGSVIALNASASTLTGAIQTDATSTTNVTLTNGALWSVTGNSTVTNLVNNASTIAFSSPTAGAFKTLTTTNYVGVGGTLILNASLGSTGSASDQLIINGGSATGTTKLVVNNIGGKGGATTGNGIPLIAAINGATTSPDAFVLANTPIVGGYEYLLGSSGDDWYLRSQPVMTQAQAINSIAAAASARQSQIITTRVLASILLARNEQVSCSNCASGFGAIGSFDVGAHGRWNLSDNLTLLAGVGFNDFSTNGVTVQNSATVAASLLYDFVNLGRTRPFFELGGYVSPYEPTTYSRSYANGTGTGTGAGSAIDRNAAFFGTGGVVSRLTPIDEAATYVSLTRDWQDSLGYSEGLSASNPFPATFSRGIDATYIVQVGVQYTHLFAPSIEVNVNGGVARSFGAVVGIDSFILDYGAIPSVVPKAVNWVELGGRIGYRVSDRMIVDAFVDGTIGPEPAGRTIHGGLGLRYAF
jgi:Autochaperone Domain Type 1